MRETSTNPQSHRGVVGCKRCPDEKGTTAFVVPFIIQILAVCGYGIYFGLTFKYKDQPTT